MVDTTLDIWPFSSLIYPLKTVTVQFTMLAYQRVTIYKWGYLGDVMGLTDHLTSPAIFKNFNPMVKWLTS